MEPNSEKKQPVFLEDFVIPELFSLLRNQTLSPKVDLTVTTSEVPGAECPIKNSGVILNLGCTLDLQRQVSQVF